MSRYVQVKDLKRTKELWERLAEEREIVITKDGQPRAVLISIEPVELESTLAEIRRSLFSAAVRRVRERAADEPPGDGTVERAVHAARKARG
jgi:prevent-host-death family protein